MSYDPYWNEVPHFGNNIPYKTKDELEKERLLERLVELEDKEGE